MKRRGLRTFWRETRASILVEGLIALPVLCFVTVGIVEFGFLMWQRQQLQVGVRDAARYWSRCPASVEGETPACSVERARNIAFYGTPDPQMGGFNRVPGWPDDGALRVTPAQDSLPLSPTADDTVTVTGEAIYRGTPLYGLIFQDTTRISYSFEMRYIGW